MADTFHILDTKTNTLYNMDEDTKLPEKKQEIYKTWADKSVASIGYKVIYEDKP